MPGTLKQCAVVSEFKILGGHCAHHCNTHPYLTVSDLDLTNDLDIDS